MTKEVRLSSREIANITGKRHDHVCRDIRKQLDELGIGEDFYASSYVTVQNKRAKEYLLDKDQAMTLVAGYSTKLRYKVMIKLHELESQQPALSFEEQVASTISMVQERAEGFKYKEGEDSRKKNKFSSFEGLLNPDLTECEKEHYALKTKFNHPKQDIGYIYAFRQNGSHQIKIGRTQNPKQRLSFYNTSSPVEVNYDWIIKCHHHKFIEKECHRMLVGNVKGEWFFVNEKEENDLKKFIKSDPYKPICNIYDGHDIMGLTEKDYIELLMNESIVHNFNGEWCLSRDFHDIRFCVSREEVFFTQKGIDWIIKKYGEERELV